MSGSLQDEAKIFGKYLLGGKMPNEQSVSLYQKAMQLKPVQLTEKETKLLQFILRNPRSASLIDSALGFFDSRNAVRKKILTMSAILETQPEYAQLFLPAERSFFYNIYIFWVGFRAVVKAVVGKILLAFI